MALLQKAFSTPLPPFLGDILGLGGTPETPAGRILHLFLQESHLLLLGNTSHHSRLVWESALSNPLAPNLWGDI
jgi:hypothetical protein